MDHVFSEVEHGSTESIAHDERDRKLRLGIEDDVGGAAMTMKASTTSAITHTGMNMVSSREYGRS